MSDLIKRQDAIDAFDMLFNITGRQNAERVVEYLQTVIQRIKDLPSSQPEIIRCKDCNHSEHWYRDKRRCFLWHETGIDVFEDGYCNYAERKGNG